MSYNIDNYQLVKFEPLRDANMKGGWIIDFMESYKKIHEREKYDKVWELIKKKNNW